MEFSDICGITFGFDPNGLVDFGGKGKYHRSQFTWFRKVVPTGITFLNSNKMGSLYKNDMFVADDLNRNIYHFKLNSQRTGLLLPTGPLADGIANSNASSANTATIANADIAIVFCFVDVIRVKFYTGGRVDSMEPTTEIVHGSDKVIEARRKVGTTSQDEGRFGESF